MVRWLALVLVSAALVALPAGALGASRPSFAHSYRGTISGTFSSSEQGNVVKSQWKVSGLVFRLTKVQAFEGGFTGIYKVTRGTLSFSEIETGTCSYSAGDKFGLAKAIPRNAASVPLALDQDPIGRKTMLGLININRKIKTTESCPDPDGGPPSMTPLTLSFPTLFDPGEKRWSPGRRLHRTNKQADRATKETWTWDLKPGR
jgi:hypothetical protein